MNQSHMKERPIFPLVLSMSLPMVLSMLVNSLYNIVDSYFVAKISEDAMTALSLVYPLQNLVNAVGVGFGIGINAAVAYFLGAEKRQAADRAVSQGLTLNLLHGILLTVGCMAGMPTFLGLFTSDPQVLDYGLRYSYIVFPFAPVITVEVSFEKIFQSVGRMEVSMVSMLAGCLLNIILDPVFIFGLGFVPAMGIEGAALATGLGQVLTLVIYLALFGRGGLPICFRLNREAFRGGVWRRLYLIGIPAALNMALPSLLVTALNGILAVYSQMYVLILGIYYKLQTFIYLTANGIVQGIRPLVGYNYGAGRPDRVRAVHRTALGLGLVIMLAGTALCLVIPEKLMGLFSDNPQTLTQGAQALRVISAGFVVSAVSVMTSGTLEGLGKGLSSLAISLLRNLAIIPIAFGLSRWLEAVGVWHAFWITEVAAAAVSLVLYGFCIRRGLSESNSRKRG